MNLKLDEMTEERFEEIFENTESELNQCEGDNAFIGLQIIAEYTDNLICGAEHDKIYSEGISELIESGITEGDVTLLAKLNWMIDEESLACFV